MKKPSSFIIITTLFTMLVGQAYALNPQPEVPSKSRANAYSNPYELNPQPEVPSKARPNEHINPYELNPQPEVPSKPSLKHEWVILKAVNSQPGIPAKKKKVNKSKHIREKHIREKR